MLSPAVRSAAQEEPRAAHLASAVARVLGVALPSSQYVRLLSYLEFISKVKSEQLRMKRIIRHYNSKPLVGQKMTGVE